MKIIALIIKHLPQGQVIFYYSQDTKQLEKKLKDVDITEQIKLILMSKQ